MTKFKTYSEYQACHGGTCVQGSIDIDYDEIVEVFGEPATGDGHKTDVQWYILFENGHVATIYNYKDGPNYLGQEAGDHSWSWADITTKNEDWHVGGLDRRAVLAVRRALRL